MGSLEPYFYLKLTKRHLSSRKMYISEKQNLITLFTLLFNEGIREMFHRGVPWATKGTQRDKGLVICHLCLVKKIIDT